MIRQLEYRKKRSEALSSAMTPPFRMTVSRQMRWDNLERIAKVFCFISLPILAFTALIIWTSEENQRRQFIEPAVSALREPENRVAPILKIWATEVLGRELAQIDPRIREALEMRGDSPLADLLLLSGSSIGGAVAISPNGNLVATGHSDGNVRLWQIPTMGEQPQVLHGHSKAVASIAFSSDGREMLTGGFDRTARLWDVATATTLIALHEPRGAVIGVAFSRESDSIITRSSDGTVQAWSRDGRRLFAFSVPE
jgi:WD40 repeat protein